MSASVKVPLSEKLNAWVEQQTRSGGYETASDYIRDLISQDRDRGREQQIDKMMEIVVQAMEGPEAANRLAKVRDKSTAPSKS